MILAASTRPKAYVTRGDERMLRTLELPGHGGRWFDLHGAAGDERAKVQAQLGFPLPPPETLREIELSSRVRRSEKGIVLNVPHFCDGASESGPLGFVLTPTMLVTEHTLEHRVLDDLAAGLDRDPVENSTDLFLRVVERITDRLADRLESIEGEVAEATRHVFARDSSEKKLKPVLRKVGEFGSEIARTHNTLLGLLRISGHLKKEPPPWFSEEDVSRNESVWGDLRSLNEFEEQLGERVQFLLDGVLGQINIDQNEIMKVMTVASVVGVPPTVLVGVWGMNFRHMPELEWPFGYAFALVAVFLSAALPLLWFWRKGWL
jgi:magnesium transporter